jgi:phytanoyl-CoA hydroxylase
MLTQEQLDSFHANGFLIMRGLIHGEELRLLTEAMNEVQRQGVAREGQDHLYSYFNETEKVYWRSEKMWTRGDIFLAVTVNPVLLENIGQCIGDAFTPCNDSMVVKVPHKGVPVKWHQDSPYSDVKREVSYPAPNFTTDIYLDYSGTDNGCVYAIPGHHQVGHVELADKSDEELYRDYGAIPVQMNPGDVLFHCVSTPHGSAPNQSDKQRRIFYIHYMSKAVCQEAYPKWERFDKDGNPNLTLYDSMLAAREKLGFAGIDSVNTIAYDRHGFHFTATPVSAADHWVELMAAMTLEEIAAKKKLQKRVAKNL